MEKINLAKLTHVASIVGILLVGYYATGMYLNILEIKRLSKEK
jgi:hypothetical protein